MANVTSTAIYSSPVNITLSLASLASSGTSGRESSAITDNIYTDGFIYLAIPVLSTTTTANDKCIYVYAYSSIDNVNFTSPATGTDAAISFSTSNTNLTLMGIIPILLTSTTYKWISGSLSSVFGGSIPKSWGIVVQNFSAATLNATESNFTKQFIGVYNTAG